MWPFKNEVINNRKLFSGEEQVKWENWLIYTLKKLNIIGHDNARINLLEKDEEKIEKILNGENPLPGLIDLRLAINEKNRQLNALMEYLGVVFVEKIVPDERYVIPKTSILMVERGRKLKNE